MRQLTIEIPEALAQRLAWLAAEQKKSIEQVALEQLTSLLEPQTEDISGSPSVIRRVMKEQPHLSREAVDDLELAIEEGKLPMLQEGVFDQR